MKKSKVKINSHNDQFINLYQKGHSLIQQKRFEDAQTEFNRARKAYKSNGDVNKIEMMVNLMIDQSRLYYQSQERRRLGTAYQKLNQCIEFVKRQFKQLQSQPGVYRQKLKLQVMIKTQFGQIYAKQAEITIQVDKIIQAIDKCLDNRVQAIKIVVNQLNNLYQDQKDGLDQDIIQQWQQLYTQSLVCLIDPLLLQAQIQLIQNPLLYPQIIMIAQRIQKFCAVFQKNEVNRRMKHKSFYYRGSTLSKMSIKYEQIQKFLVDDYQFCKRGGYFEDSQKSRVQLLSLAIKYCRMQKIKQYLGNQENKKIYAYDVMPDYKRVQQLQRQIKSAQFLSKSESSQKKMIEQLTNKIEKHQWFKRLPPTLTQVLPSIKQKSIQALMHFYLAKAYMELFNQLNATDQCRFCLQVCQNLTNQSNNEQVAVLQYNCTYLLMQIQGVQFKLEQVMETAKKLKVLAQNTYRNDIKVYNSKIQQINEYTQKRNLNKKRHNLIKKMTVESQQQKQLYSYCKMFKQQKQKAIDLEYQQMQEEKQSEIYVSHIYGYNYNGPSVISAKRQNHKEQLLQKYKNYCTNNQLLIRKGILTQIQKLKSDQSYININFEQYFDICVQQLLILIQLNKSETIDLRNLHISTSILQKFLQHVNSGNSIRKIKTLKLSGLDRMISKQTFSQFIKSLEQIEYLHLQKLTDKLIQNQQKQMKLQLSSPHNLQVLKLKFCKLNDTFLLYIAKQFPNLKQLDLAANQISGIALYEVNKLLGLQKLNLSYNPIVTLKFLNNPSLRKLKLKQISVRMDPMNQQILHSRQITYLQVLDLSQNKSQMVLFLLKSMHQYIIRQQLIQLGNLVEIRIKKSVINQAILSTINQIMINIIKQMRLDFRYSQCDMARIQKFYAYQKQYQKIACVDCRAGSPIQSQQTCLDPL